MTDAEVERLRGEMAATQAAVAVALAHLAGRTASRPEDATAALRGLLAELRGCLPSALAEMEARGLYQAAVGYEDGVETIAKLVSQATFS